MHGRPAREIGHVASTSLRPTQQIDASARSAVESLHDQQGFDDRGDRSCV
jgi:hypothetical protein